MNTLESIQKQIDEAESIVILVHENPDGDAIGSCMAMYHALKQYGKNPDVIVPEYSRVFSFLPGIEDIKKESEIKEYDLAIALDCATIKLLNGWAAYFENAKNTVVIDHHSTNSMFGDLNYVDLNAPACSQILTPMFRSFGVEITKEIGTCIMTGIITDTGGFQYSGVTKETFESVSELLSLGVKVSDIYKKVMSTKSKASFELRKIAMNRLEFYEDDRIAFTYITHEDEEEVSAETGDYEGCVDEGRNIEGVEVSIFLHQMGDSFKVSLRSNYYVNVSDIAMIYGGGGHPKAAGCKLKGTPEQIKMKIINEAKKALK